MLYESYYGIRLLDFDSELFHHGTKGMHWYQRRYQNPDGSLTALGRIHYGIGKAREKHQIKKEERVKRKAERAEAKRVAAEERLASEKDKAIKTGDMAYINKNRSAFTTQEINEALNRVSAFNKVEATLPKKQTFGDELKRQAIAKGDIKYVKKHAEDFSTDELKDAFTRMDTLRKIKDLEPPKQSLVAGINKILEGSTKTINNISNFKNAIKNLGEAFEDEDDKKERKAKADQDVEWQKNVLTAAKNAADNARKNTEGSIDDKEKAARKAFDDTIASGKKVNEKSMSLSDAFAKVKSKAAEQEKSEKESAKAEAKAEKESAKAEAKAEKQSIKDARKAQRLVNKVFSNAEKQNVNDTRKAQSLVNKVFSNAAKAEKQNVNDTRKAQSRVDKVFSNADKRSAAEASELTQLFNKVNSKNESANLFNNSSANAPVSSPAVKNAAQHGHDVVDDLTRDLLNKNAADLDDWRKNK